MPTKKKTEEITDSIMEAQNETEEQNTAPPAAEEPTEKPKRTRKKKTEITETEEPPVNETVEPQTEDTTDEEAAAEPVKPKSRILTVEAKAEVYTEQTRADIIWHEIQNAYITHRIMTGTLSGVECNDAGHHYAIADYNGFRIVIPLKEMFFDFPTNLHGDEYKEAVMRYNKLMNSMLGAEIDFVVRGIDSKARSVVASRKEAMYKKRQTFYMETDENGMFRIYEDRIVQARVTAVAEKAIRVEIFGVDCAMPVKDLSWDWLGDAGERFSIGDKILVRIKEVERESIKDIYVRADARSVTDNRTDNLSSCRIQGKYAGRVTDTHKGVVYIRLNNGVNAIAHSCLDRRMPGKKDDVSFVVTAIEEERGVALGIITRIIKQNL